MNTASYKLFRTSTASAFAAAGLLFAVGAAGARAQQFGVGVQFGAPAYGYAPAPVGPAYAAPPAVYGAPAYGYAAVNPYYDGDRDAFFRAEQREHWEREHFEHERMEHFEHERMEHFDHDDHDWR